MQQSRSARLRKYAIAYEECLKKMPVKKTKPPRSRRVKNPDIKTTEVRRKSPEEPKRSLNSYQIFVRDESKKTKYDGISAQERMTVMAKEWKKSKDRK